MIQDPLITDQIIDTPCLTPITGLLILEGVTPPLSCSGGNPASPDEPSPLAMISRRTSKSLVHVWWSGRSPDGRDSLVATAQFYRPLPVAWMKHWTVEDAEADESLETGILAEASGGLTSANATIRERIFESARWSQRKQSHLKLAHACLQPPTRLEAAAHHFEQGGQNDAASRAYLGAADAPLFPSPGLRTGFVLALRRSRS